MTQVEGNNNNHCLDEKDIQSGKSNEMTTMQKLVNRLRQQHVLDLEVYRSAHKDRRNRVLHWILIPVECWSLLAFLHWFTITYVADNILRVATMVMMMAKNIDGDEEGNGTEQQSIAVLVAIILWLLSSLPALITVGLGVLSLLISSPSPLQSSSSSTLSKPLPSSPKLSQYRSTTSERRNEDNDNGHTNNLRNRNGVKCPADKTSKKTPTTSSSMESNSLTSSTTAITAATNLSVVGRLCFFFHIGCAWSFYMIVPPSWTLLPPSVSHFSSLLLQQHKEEEDYEDHYYVSKTRNNCTVLGYIVMAWIVSWTLQIFVGHWMWEQNRPNISPSTVNEVSYLAMCQSVLIAWSS